MALYKATVSRMLRSWRLYSWMRLIWTSNRANGSTTTPVKSRTRWANLLILDKQSYSPHIGARDFCWHGWGHEEAGRSCGAGGTAFAGRAVAATRGTSGRSGAAAGREPNLGWTVGRRAQVERCGWLAQSAAHRAAAAADRGQEEAFGCRA